MASIELKLKPIMTPNFVQAEMPPGLKQDGLRELPSFPLKELSVAALDGLVAQWLSELYEKAGKQNAWELNRALPK